MNDHERSSVPFVKAASSAPSLAVDLLHLLVECRPFLDCDEALDAELLPGLRHGLDPALDVLVPLLASCARLLAHDLPVRVFDKVRLCKTSLGHLLGARKDGRPHVLTLC